MKNSDMPASPQSGFCTIDGDTFVSGDCGGVGLTKREAFAKDLPHIDVEFGDLGVMCKFIGVDTVPESINEILAVTFEVEAKIRVMRADALLAELEK